MNTMYISGKENMSKREEKKLIRHICKKRKEYEGLVIGKKLKNNSEFVKQIEKLNIPIADGRWLFKLLVIQIIEYISQCQDIDMKEQRIALVTSENNKVITYYIEELTKLSNKLKIITSNRERFYSIEEKLYYNQGIVMEISNNRRKGLRDVDIIINFDLDSDRLNKYRIEEKAIIINLREKIEIKSKRFAGINVNFYEIDFKNRLIEALEWTKEFEKKELYESYIYRDDEIYNIEKEILKDNIIVTELIGTKGRISEKEYRNILDKRNYLA